MIWRVDTRAPPKLHKHKYLQHIISGFPLINQKVVSLFLLSFCLRVFWRPQKSELQRFVVETFPGFGIPGMEGLDKFHRFNLCVYVYMYLNKREREREREREIDR